MSSRRRQPCSPSAASPLDDDDLLAEILLRLPPQPSSLPRASLVSKRWRLLVSDPRFVRRFRIHHRRSPPLLGCFVERCSTLSFVPTMESPNRVPPGRLSLQFDHGRFFQPLGCRHGLALIADQTRQQFIVWEPITGDQHQIAVPPEFDLRMPPMVNGAVLRVAGDVHFQVVIVAIRNDDTHPGQRALACVYSSETGLWGDLISTQIPLEPDYGVYSIRDHAVLVRDSLYWQLTGFSSSILEVDFKKQSLAVIQVPVDQVEEEDDFKVVRADGGGLGLLSVSDFTAQLWERNTDCDGVASWVLGRTIELGKLLSLDSEVHDDIMILAFAEENNMVFLWIEGDAFMVQLQSLQFKKLTGFNIAADYFPFESVYTAETGIGGEHDGAELLHNS